MTGDGSARRARSNLPLVIGSFSLGWLFGVGLVFKFWSFAHAPRWLMLSGMTMVSFLMAPCLSGVLFSRGISRLVARGWRGAPLGLIGLGACGAIAGLLAL